MKTILSCLVALLSMIGTASQACAADMTLRDAIYLYGQPLNAKGDKLLVGVDCDVFQLVLDVTSGYTNLSMGQGNSLTAAVNGQAAYPDRINDTDAMFAYALYKDNAVKTFVFNDQTQPAASTQMGSATVFGYCYSTKPTAHVYLQEKDNCLNTYSDMHTSSCSVADNGSGSGTGTLGSLALRDAIYLYGQPFNGKGDKVLVGENCDVFQLVLDVTSGYTDLAMGQAGTVDAAITAQTDYADRIHDTAAMFSYALYQPQAAKAFAFKDKTNPGSASQIGAGTVFGYCYSANPNAKVYLQQKDTCTRTYSDQHTEAVPNCTPASAANDKLLVTPAGKPFGPTITVTIGPDGGVLAMPDESVSVTIPPGAVGTDTEFSLTRLTNPTGNALATYRFEPDGIVFAIPATLRFKFPNAGTSGTSMEWLRIAGQSPDGHWQWLNNVAIDTVDKTLSAEITHFSVYSGMAGYQIKPSYGYTKINESVELEIMQCLTNEQAQQWGSNVSLNSPGVGGVESVQARQGVPPATVFQIDSVYECRSLDILEAKVFGWSVNGVPNGNQTYGLVSANNKYTATYYAPSKQPSPNTVRVEVEFRDSFIVTSNQPTGYLFSYITIEDPADYGGWFAADFYMDDPMIGWVHAEGSASWTKIGTDEFSDKYAVELEVTPDRTVFQDEHERCVLNAPTQKWASQYARIYTDPPAWIHWQIWAVWTATCTDLGTGSPGRDLSLVLSWATECIDDSNTMQVAEIDQELFPETLLGHFTSASGKCSTEYYDADVRWIFDQQK